MANKPSTQKYLDISEIKENLVTLKDGTLRAVIICSSINFSLLSEDEQQAKISGYMQFLNALDHPLQIVVQSRKLDIEGYIKRLQEAQKKQTNELLKAQIIDYMAYVQQLIELGEIMTKRFFVVVPYDPLGDKARGFWPRFKALFSATKIIAVKKEQFEEYKEKMQLRINNILSGLNSMGLDAVQLDTQGLIELYYNVYNPKTSQSQKLKEIDKLNLET